MPCTKTEPATPREVPTAQLNGFKLAVPEASLHTSSPQYAALKQGDVFSFELGNALSQDCDCDLFLDGVLVGHYRVPAKKTILVERPTALALRFTYSAQGTIANFDTHLPLEAAQIGLVKAVFKPEGSTQNAMGVPPQLTPPQVMVAQQKAETVAHPFDVSATAKASTQQFAYVPNLTTDDAHSTTLFMRLVSASGVDPTSAIVRDAVCDVGREESQLCFALN